jgi:uncharacterized membrane protein
MTDRPVQAPVHTQAPADQPTACGLSPRLLAVLAYGAWWASGAFVMAIEPGHAFVRFHARQALVGFGVLWLVGVTLWASSFVLAFVSPLAFRTSAVLAQATWAVGLVLTLVCGVSAWRGRRWPLPWLRRSASRS